MSERTNRFRRFGRDRSGQTLLEFAFASIIFFITVFGTIEFGLAIWQYNMMSDLAQEGARWASVHGSSSASPASAADVQTYVRSRATSFTLTVTTSPEPSATAPGSTITVQVQSSFTPVTRLIPHSTLTFQRCATMLVSR
jgi:Flp pilus assembly protein TadG